jgi:hypothetical protein
MESGKYIIRFETPISLMHEISWIDYNIYQATFH